CALTEHTTGADVGLIAEDGIVLQDLRHSSEIRHRPDGSAPIIILSAVIIADDVVLNDAAGIVQHNAGTVFPGVVCYVVVQESRISIADPDSTTSGTAGSGRIDCLIEHDP